MHLRGLNRWQAFMIHLGISAAIFIVLLAIIVVIWYPGVFIHLGGWQGIQIVAVVDLVLGPLLTLIVFNPVKKSLPMDLSIIAAIQIACLGYGVWVVEQQRPFAQILLDDTLFVIPKADYIEREIDLDILANIPGPSPKLIMLDLPNDHTMIAVKLVKDLFSGNPLQYHTDLYLPITTANENSLHQEKLAWRLARLSHNKDKNCYWLPVDSAHYSDAVCFTPDKGPIAMRPYSYEPPKLDTEATEGEAESTESEAEPVERKLN
ncbi:MAG: hypothetical protein V3T17_04700 [Pseudomonadales bacterium]